jgi:hypothetical protein
MADRTWHKAFLLAAVGVALAAGCTINSETSDDDDGGEAGTGGTAGGTGGKGGTSGSGGTAGKGGTSGSGGSAGSTAGSGGTSGSAGSGGSAGSTAGSSGAGTGGTGVLEDDDPLCDPPSGMLDSTPYDTCAPAAGEETDPCALCIQADCCDESEACYAYAPGNVCGWGGPMDDDDEYLGGGEIGCYRSCILDFVENEGDGAYDETAEGDCVAACTTEMDASGMECDGNIGTATSDMTGCMKTSCDDECFLTP